MHFMRVGMMRAGRHSRKLSHDEDTCLVSWNRLGGRWVASFLIISTLVAYVALTFYRRGGLKAEQIKRTTRALKRLKERIGTDENIRRMPVDERRKRLSDDWGGS